MSDTVIVIQSVAETVQTVQTEAVVGQVPVTVVVGQDQVIVAVEDESGDAATVSTVQPETVIVENPIAVVIEDEYGGVMPEIANPNDGEVHLTPKSSSSGAEGTMFYNDADDHVYVATE